MEPDRPMKSDMACVARPPSQGIACHFLDAIAKTGRKPESVPSPVIAS
jgi:hypothetical protein